jgi:hypothetical protein
MSCNVCVAPLNKTTRRPVACGQCQFEACRDCHKTYVLGSVNEPHCMNCKVPWDSDFIIGNFTQKFFNVDLVAHRGNALFEREKALMPQTQEDIRVKHLEEEVKGLRGMVNLYKQILRPDEAARYQALLEAREAEFPNNIPQTSAAPRAGPVPRPVCGCVRPECRGFVMSGTWKCGVCTVKVCSDCLKECGDDHKCAAEDIETRKLLLKDTKPCPKCGVMISKTEGCSQMWCVMCHTTFDWRSGEIVVNEVLHNPHYYEWMRRTGQQIPRHPADQPPQCVEEGAVPVHMFEEYLWTIPKGQRNTFTNMYRLANHIAAVLLPDLNADDQTEVYNALRTDYLLQKMSEEKYKTELVKVERKMERQTAERQIAALFATQVAEQIRHAYNSRMTSVQPIITQMSTLATYCNEQFKRVGRAYKATTWYYITPVTLTGIRKTNKSQ